MTQKTVDQVATEVGSTRSAIRKAIARGLIKATLAPGTYGQTYLIDEEEVDRYRTRHRRMAPGSSERCRSKSAGRRCRRRTGHDGAHLGKKGQETVRWEP